MGPDAWIGIAVAVGFVAICIVLHQQYRRDLKRDKKSRWTTWRDEPRSVYREKYGDNRGRH
jgi:hypothetical protein